MTSLPEGCARWGSDPAIGAPAPEDCVRSFNALLRSTARLQGKTTNKIEADETVVEHFAGGRTQRMYPNFRVEDGWSVAWQSDGEIFRATVHRAGASGDEGTIIADTDQAGRGEHAFDDGGRFYIEVDAARNWAIEILQHQSGYTYEYDVSVGYELQNPFNHVIAFEYTDGRGETQNVELAGRSTRRIVVASLLTGFESPQHDTILLSELEPPQINEIISMDPVAVERRAHVAQVLAERERKLARTRAEAERARAARERAALEEFDSTSRKAERNASAEERERERRELAKAVSDSRKKTVALAGSGTGLVLAGIGGGVALIAVGSSRLPAAETALAEYERFLATKTERTNRQKIELSDRQLAVGDAKRLRTFGILASITGVVAAVPLFVVAGVESGRRKKLTSSDELSRRPARPQLTGVTPLWTREGGYLSLQGRF